MNVDVGLVNLFAVVESDELKNSTDDVGSVTQFVLLEVRMFPHRRRILNKPSVLR